MLSDVCAEIRNYFLKCPRSDIHFGKFSIENGSIESLSFLQEGQYFRIKGSVFSDGVWIYGNTTFQKDETFVGEIWAMSVPQEIISLSDEIDTWIAENAEALNSPYQSESFGGYSYSKGGSRYGDSGTAAYGWKNQFAARLSPYRRISVL